MQLNLKMNKFKSSDNKQIFLLPPSVEDFVPESHLSRLIYEVVDQLDTTDIENKYSYLGQKSYHPKLIIRILFYGYSTGVLSGRKLAQCCESDMAFMYLSNMFKPDFRTINDFRKNNITELAGYFTSILKICQQLGMAKAGTLIIDSVKLRANASLRHTKTKAELETTLNILENEIKQSIQEAVEIDEAEDKQYGKLRGDELPAILKSKEKLAQNIRRAISEINNADDKVNITDTDAKVIQDKSSKQLNYNCQTAITTDRIIVSAEATNQASDRPGLMQTIHDAELNATTEYKNIIADAGYGSYDNYEKLVQEDRVAYIPDQKYLSNDEDNPFDRSHFIFNENTNTFTCPLGEQLSYTSTSKSKKKQHVKIYKAKNCPQCSAQSLCTKGKYRQLHIELREQLRDNVRKRLNSPAGKQLYKIRLHTIESIFGNLKHNLKIKQFQLRNLKNVDAEFKIHCMMHNLKQIFKAKYQMKGV